MTGRVAVNDPGKLIVVCIALVGGIVLALVGALVRDASGLTTAGVGLATAALGYTFGNGRLAARVEAPATMIAPVLSEHEWVRKDELRALALAQRHATGSGRRLADVLDDHQGGEG